MKKNPINISVLINIYLIKFIRFDLNKVAENNKPNLIWRYLISVVNYYLFYVLMINYRD